MVTALRMNALNEAEMPFNDRTGEFRIISTARQDQDPRKNWFTSALPHDGNGQFSEATANCSTSIDMNQLEQYRMQQQQMMPGIEIDAYYRREQLSAMENIERGISDLGNMFRQLASLVSEQGEVITRIDAHVEETSMNMEGANYHLLRHSHNVWMNRERMIKVFGVLVIVFFIYFFVFMT